MQIDYTYRYDLRDQLWISSVVVSQIFSRLLCCISDLYYLAQDSHTSDHLQQYAFRPVDGQNLYGDQGWRVQSRI